MAKTRKGRALSRRIIQHGGVGPNSPLVEIIIFLKAVKEVYDNNFLAGLNDGTRAQIGITRAEFPDEQSIKEFTRHDRNNVPIDMVRGMFARAQVNGVPQFSEIISAEWYDRRAPPANDVFDFGIRVRVRTDLDDQQILNYFQGYNLAIEHAAFEDNGWVFFIAPGSNVVFSRLYLLDQNDDEDNLGIVRILRGQALPQNIPQPPNIPDENNQNGGARRRKSKSKRKSSRVTRKKRRAGRR